MRAHKWLQLIYTFNQLCMLSKVLTWHTKECHWLHHWVPVVYIWWGGAGRPQGLPTPGGGDLLPHQGSPQYQGTHYVSHTGQTVRVMCYEADESSTLTTSTTILALVAEVSVVLLVLKMVQLLIIKVVCPDVYSATRKPGVFAAGASWVPEQERARASCRWGHRWPCTQSTCSIYPCKAGRLKPVSLSDQSGEQVNWSSRSGGNLAATFLAIFSDFMIM